MQKYVTATIAIALGCWGMSVTSAAVIGSSGPLTFAASITAPALGERPSGIHLIADAPRDEPTDGGPVEIFLNTGYCTADPPIWKYIKDAGVYYYEFCDYPLIKNYLKVDVHGKASSGGGLGTLVTKLIKPCSMWYPGTDFLPPDVVTDFCHD